MLTFSNLGKKSIAHQADASAPSSLSAQALIFTSHEDLAGLPSPIARFRDDLIGEQLSTKVCPAQLDSGQWVIFVTPDYINSDLVKTAEEKSIIEGGSKQKPLIQMITPTLLLTLREDDPSKSSSYREKETVTAYKAAFHEIITWGIRNNASDAHLNVHLNEPYSQVCFSIEGKYIAPERWKIKTDRMIEILNVAWMDSKGGSSPVFSADSEQQCRIEVLVDHSRVMARWASLATDSGPSVTLRLLRIDVKSVNKSLADQGYLPSQIKMLERVQMSEGGSFIIAGVVGSGKSTTLANLLSALPNTRKVITLEDPVEYRIPNALQNTISRSLEGNDSQAFESKLRTIKRSAPHDLMIGEIRDPETAKAFVDIVGSGTSIYSTVHAKSAMHIPERLSSSSIGIPRDLLGSPGILNLLVFQALIPTLCQHCALPLDTLCEKGGQDIRGIMHDPAHWKAYKKLIGGMYSVSTDQLKVRNTDGCEHCKRADLPELNGYSGRTVVAEMIEPGTDLQVLKLIRNGDTIGLQQYFENYPKAPINDPDMTGKSLMECAVYKMLMGLFDPRDVEVRTHSFETVALQKGYRP
ncbi:ATPase, T2SS/T4P/T4SS family (plasmid) [Pseudomonas sp. FeN3W]|nr:ATPase, T2SS/T4P/T4SS family [Pseudomonas sp. FeN3W]